MADGVVISGGGIAGLLLALSLKHRLNLDCTVYEQATAYSNFHNQRYYNLIFTFILINKFFVLYLS